MHESAEYIRMSRGTAAAMRYNPGQASSNRFPFNGAIVRSPASDQPKVDVRSRETLLPVRALDCLAHGKPGRTALQVARALGLPDDRVDRNLSGDLDRLVRRGLVRRDTGGRYRLSPGFVLIHGRVRGHPAGHGFLLCDGRDEELYLRPDQMRRVMHDDEIWCGTLPGAVFGKSKIAIVGIARRNIRTLVGRAVRNRGAWHVIAADRRVNNPIGIAAAHAGDVSPGDTVLIELAPGAAESPYAGRVIEVIGSHDDAGIQSRAAIRGHGIPDCWPAALTARIERMKDGCVAPGPGRHRTDVRDLPLVTIDGTDARDFDDAVYCRKTGAGWHLAVAIADVSHYVKAGDPLDQEAFARGTSVYFPDQVVPMLPEYLSNGICSLNPGEDRFCMVCEMELDDRGQTGEYRFYQAVMRSRSRLSYEQVNGIVVDRDRGLREAHGPVCSSLDALHALASRRRSGRLAAGAIDFRIAEPFIELGSDCRPVSICARPRLPSHELIEECMLAANMCAAEFLHAHFGDQGIYRNHGGPAEEDLARLRHFLGSLGLRLGGGQSPGPQDYQTLLQDVRDRPDIGTVAQSVLLRSLSKACYESRPAGHFALAVPLYTHFTSPIRRYGDLVVHRLVKRALQIPGYRDADVPAGELARVARQCTETELRADRAVQDVSAWLKAAFMERRVGQSFPGSITGVREFGVFVRIEQFLVDGLVHVSSLGTDYFFYEESLYQLTGEKSGITYRLGDRLEIEVSHVNLDEKKIDFILAGSSAKRAFRSQPTRRGRKKRRR